MDKIKLKIGWAAFVIIVGGLFIPRGAASGPSRQGAAQVRFAGLSAAESMASARKMSDSYARKVADLCSQLKVISAKFQPGSDVWRVRAGCVIHVLGCMRASDAVPAILRQIELTVPWPGVNGFQPMTMIQWRHYPAVHALTQIGLPSVKAILKGLPHEKDQVRRRLMARVMLNVCGARFAKFMLMQAIAGQKSAAGRKRIRSAITCIENPGLD